MNLSKMLILVGLSLIVAGVFARFLGRLPGDLRYEGRNVKIYFPWVTCLLLSLVLTALSYLFRRFRG